MRTKHVANTPTSANSRPFFQRSVAEVCVSNLTSDLKESHNGMSRVRLVVVLFAWKKIPTNKLETKHIKVVLCSNAQLALP